MKKEIQEVIRDDNLTMTEKLLKIAIVVDDKDKDWLFELSEIFGYSVEMIKNWDFGKVNKKTEEPKELNGLQAYIDIFHKCYENIYKRKFEFIGKEIGQLKNIKKSMNKKKFRDILVLIYRIYKQREKGVKLKTNTWNFILDNLSPSIIFNQYNFIMNQMNESKKSKSKKWEW